MTLILWGQATSVPYIWLYLENEDFLLQEPQEATSHLEQFHFCLFLF